jgi:hypothetical protein
VFGLSAKLQKTWAVPDFEICEQWVAMNEADADGMEVVLAGPVLRRVQARSVALWLATSCAVRLRVAFAAARRPHPRAGFGGALPACLPTGRRLHLQLVQLSLDEDLPQGLWTGYRLEWATPGEEPPRWVEATGAELCYSGRKTPGFVHQRQVRAVRMVRAASRTTAARTVWCVPIPTWLNAWPRRQPVPGRRPWC